MGGCRRRRQISRLSRRKPARCWRCSSPPATRPLRPTSSSRPGVFLDVVGEALRGRTYVFTDLDGKELCLRPDLTVPTCRLYLQRHPDADRRPSTATTGRPSAFNLRVRMHAHPREFRQAGIEAFGDKDAGEADARTLVLMLRALQQAGLPGWKLRIGDVALFDALLRVSRHSGALAAPAASPVLAPRSVSRRAQAAVDQSGALGRRISARAYRGAGSRAMPRRRKASSPSTSSKAASSSSACARRRRSPKACSP